MMSWAILTLTCFLSRKRPSRPKPFFQSCVLCVGSTGTGKSFTISTMTGLPVASNAGADSVTKRCALYRPMTKLKDQTPNQLSWWERVPATAKWLDPFTGYRWVLMGGQCDQIASMVSVTRSLVWSVRWQIYFFIKWLFTTISISTKAHNKLPKYFQNCAKY